MISAKEAFKKTYYNDNLKKLLEKIEAGVDDAIANSKFNTSINIFRSSDNKVYQDVIKYLEELGYEVAIKNNGKSSDVIEISWEKYTIDEINE